MRNIRIVVAYDGTDFHGWQRQPDAPTVQACLEGALHRLTGAPTALYGSGRTDAGVHASGQIANFQTASSIPTGNFVKALNDLIPRTVRIVGAEEVDPAFHARYAARSKTYRYRMVLSPVCSPLLGRFVYHHPYLLDRFRMAAAARYFTGEHDFTSFSAADSEDEDDLKSKVRTIFRSRLRWRPRSQMLVYEVVGNGFLRYMVRTIVGTLIEVGRGRLEPDDIPGILVASDRSQAGPTAPAQGLCLVKVEYAK